MGLLLGLAGKVLEFGVDLAIEVAKPLAKGVFGAGVEWATGVDPFEERKPEDKPSPAPKGYNRLRYRFRGTRGWRGERR